MVAQQGTRLAIRCSPERLCLFLEEPTLPIDVHHLGIGFNDLLLSRDPSALRDLALGLCALGGEQPASGCWAVFQEDGTVEQTQLFGPAGPLLPPEATERYVVSLQVKREPSRAESVDVEALTYRTALAPLPIDWNQDSLSEPTWEPPAQRRRFRPKLYPADFYSFEPALSGRGLALKPPAAARVASDPRLQGENTSDTRVFYRWSENEPWADDSGLESCEMAVGPYFLVVDGSLEQSMLYPVQAGVLLDPIATRLACPGLHIACAAPDLRTEWLKAQPDERLTQLEESLKPGILKLYLLCLERHAELEPEQSRSEVMSGILASVVMAIPVGGALGSLFGSPGLGMLAFGAIGTLVSTFVGAPLVGKFSWGKLTRARLEKAMRALRFENA